jgi:hypothetical protein
MRNVKHYTKRNTSFQVAEDLKSDGRAAHAPAGRESRAEVSREAEEVRGGCGWVVFFFIAYERKSMKVRLFGCITLI